MKVYASEEALNLLTEAGMLRTEYICFNEQSAKSSVVVALNQAKLAIGRFTKSQNGTTKESWTPTLLPQAYSALLNALNMAQGDQHTCRIDFGLPYLTASDGLNYISGYFLFDSFDQGILTLFVESKPYTIQITPLRLNQLRNYLNQVVRTNSVQN